jgi:predicted dehydrogenase
MAEKKIRYAVVGLGWIGQSAVLPAFKNADNCELTALFSEDPEKQKQLAAKYGVPVYPYEEYDAVLQWREFDAVYITLPNHLHADYTVRAAKAGIHVLCEKPMAVTEEECERMIAACTQNQVQLMIAYRLHFDEMNLEAIDEVRSGSIGEPRYFTSAFSQIVPEGDIRLRRETGGGTLYDLGVYCINAARNLFASEPIEALAVTVRDTAPKFREIEEMSAAVLRFPNNRLATFTCGFGAATVSSYQIAGTKGDILANPAYSFDQSLKFDLTVEGETYEHKFKRSDQFAPELIYFANCILTGIEPEPDGWEGLADVRVIRALYRSAETAAPVSLEPFIRTRRPGINQEMYKRAVKAPDLVNARDPSEAA